MDILQWPLSFTMGCITLYTAVTYILVIQRKSTNRGMVAMAITAVVVLLVAIFADRSVAFYNFMFSVPPIMVVVCVSLDMRFKRSILAVTGAYLAISIVSNFSLGVVYSLVDANANEFYLYESVNILADCLASLLVLSIGIVAYWVRKKRGTLQTQQGTASVFMLFSLACFFVGMAPVTVLLGELAGTKHHNSSIIGIALFSITFLLGTLVTQIVANRSITMKSEIEAYRLFSDGQAQYFQSMLGWNKEVRKLQHDLWAHNLYIKECLGAGEYTKASEYLDELLAQASNVKAKKVNSGNMACDIVVNHLTGLFNVRFNIVGLLPPNLHVKDIELCIMLSNLLSNAAEAVQHTKTPQVDVHFKVAGTHLYIMVQNPSEGKLQIKNKLPLTTKGASHGYGLQNVSDAVQRNNGYVQFTQEDGVFKAEITLVDCIVEDSAA